MAKQTFYPSKLSAQQKQAAYELIKKHPGLKSRDIAERIGLDRSELNRFLWGEGVNVLGLYNQRWRWHYSGEVTPTIPGLDLSHEARVNAEPEDLSLEISRLAELEAPQPNTPRAPATSEQLFRLMVALAGLLLALAFVLTVVKAIFG